MKLWATKIQNLKRTSPLLTQYYAASDDDGGKLHFRHNGRLL